MATIQFKGLAEYEAKLSKLGAAAEPVIDKAISAGAGVMADAIREGIKNIPTIGNQHGTSERKLYGATREQKKGLLDGLGITPLKNEGGIYNRKIGFDGYNEVKTKKYPRGQPNQLIARSIESGTSFRWPTKFISTAVRKARKETEKVMAETLDSEISKIMN